MQVGWIGFALISSNRDFILARCKRLVASSSLVAKLMALDISLDVLKYWCLNIHSIYTDCLNVKMAILSQDRPHIWRDSQIFQKIKDSLHNYGDIIAAIPRNWNSLADHLVAQGHNAHCFSLFHQGMDLPHWFMEAICTSSFL